MSLERPQTINEQRIPTPWVRIRADRGGRFRIDGSPRAVLGHQIAVAGGLDRPDGVYVQWDWDGRELSVRNDRAGMGQMLYAPLDDGDGIVLSPHVEQLLELGASSQFDDGAATVLLRLGFLLDVDTPYKDIRALPPNATLTWSPGKLHVHDGRQLPQPQVIDRDVAVDTYVDLFRQSIGRRLPGEPTVLPLTGGQDSRHILFELCRRAQPPDVCVTVRPYRKVTYDDAYVARELAAQLDVPHQSIELARSPVAEDFRKYFRLGPLSDEGGWTSAMWDHIQSFACAYDGIAGDMLSSGSLAGLVYTPQVHELVERREWSSLAGVILDHFAAPESAYDELIGKASHQDLGREYVMDRVEQQLRRVSDTAHPVAMFMIYNRTRREIAMMSWLLCSQLTPYYAPYLDRDLFSFLASLPASEFAVGQWFHRAAISKGYPEWAEIPYFDPQRVTSLPMSPLGAVSSIVEVNAWTARHLPALLPVVARWGVRRIKSRGHQGVAPRRVVQHFLALERLYRRGFHGGFD